MKEIFRYIKNTNRQYKISNYGRVFSVKSDRFLKNWWQRYVEYTYLPSGNFSVAKLVLSHFKPKQIPNSSTLNLDGNPFKNQSDNLKWSSRGDRLRMINRYKNRERGVLKYKRPESKSKWRAVLKVDNQVITLGYTKTKEEARKIFIEGFTNWYGYSPYRS